MAKTSGMKSCGRHSLLLGSLGLKINEAFASFTCFWWGLVKWKSTVLFVSPPTKNKADRFPREAELQLQISWTLLCCLWAILQFDQCIMSRAGPSLCADASVTLTRPVKCMCAGPASSCRFPPLSLSEPTWFCPWWSQGKWNSSLPSVGVWRLNRGTLT